MLSRLLRASYLLQLLCGAALGLYLLLELDQVHTQPWAMLLLPATAVAMPVLLQWVVITVTMLRSSRAGSMAHWWRAWVGEFRAAVLIFMLRQPWPKQQRGVQMPLSSASQGPGHPRLPVLLVHGYLCNHRVWDDVAAALGAAGHPVLAVDLEPLFGSIDDYAPVIERGVDCLLETSRACQLVLLGHSMGGLAIRAWQRAHGADPDPRVARIITLGTPHQGTRLAKGSLTRNGAQMVWQSPWLQALAASEGVPTRQLMHLALTQQDNIVFPQTEQVLAGAQVTEFFAMGHLQMCLHPQVIEWVLQTANVKLTPVPAR
jgi:triacylglycerol lipase